MSKSSSGDRGAERCPYLQYWFWIDPVNWYWEKSSDQGFKDRMYKRLVEPAIEEGMRKNKSDVTNWKLK